MNTLQITIYRMKLRKALVKADWEQLQITKEELRREFERRQKNK